MSFKQFLLESKIDPYKFLDWDKSLWNDLKVWINSLQLEVGKAPRGLKKQWDNLKFIHRQVNSPFGLHSGALSNIGASFSLMTKEDIDLIISKTSNKNKKVEYKGNNAIFKNKSNMAESTFLKRSKSLDKHLSTLKGFHRKAITIKPLEVIFVKKEQSKSTAVYKSELDKIFIRPDRRAIDGDKYGSFNYIITHELGHRFERLVKSYPEFNILYTTKYSKTNSWESEAFAELFALSHYGIKVYPQYENQIKKFINTIK